MLIFSNYVKTKYVRRLVLILYKSTQTILKILQNVESIFFHGIGLNEEKR